MQIFPNMLWILFLSLGFGWIPRVSRNVLPCLYFTLIFKVWKAINEGPYVPPLCISGVPVSPSHLYQGPLHFPVVGNIFGLLCSEYNAQKSNEFDRFELVELLLWSWGNEDMLVLPRTLFTRVLFEWEFHGPIVFRMNTFDQLLSIGTCHKLDRYFISFGKNLLRHKVETPLWMES